MTHGFRESEDGLHYAEHISWPMRLFVAVIGLAMFLIPVPFLQHGHWGLPWWQLLLLAVCITLPVLLGTFFLCLAGGRCLRLHFDKRQRCLVRHGRLPLPPRAIPYADIEPPSVLERSSEDGPYYVLRLRVQGERAMHLSSFGLQTEAQVWCQRIADELQHR
ncbi:hypothetical protein HS961_05900 [Comamonas piscis]|uniref:Uncharacterized protein n=1 Tax=Comamonas piscis TaxID=1562974 RepID=A0A7G5EEH7_9BURK|nr:hypothetical protein [Comamonas piscis]QMV72402.1 hypothetical protein HS961_05900 [Comamonas piscis]WSO35170.1 hypothetical protein VUJ63_05925 [Comamonas piscis]